MPPKKAHQAVPSQAVAEPPPPAVAVPRRRPVSRPQPPRLRGRADAKHPSEDGKRMALNSLQAQKMVDLECPLRFHFSKRDDVLVAIDLLVYYTEAPYPQRIAPNIFVSFNVPSYPREIYRLAEEGKPPDWIIEVAALEKCRYDLGGKKDLYEELGVGEYMVYDPEGGLHEPRLRGWELRSGRYVELADLGIPGVPVALRSEALGLELHFDGENLRLWDPSTANYLRRLDESERRGDKEEAGRKAAEEKLEITEEKLAVAEEKLAVAEAQIESEVGACREAEQRAETNARAMEARIAALTEELRRLGR